MATSLKDRDDSLDALLGEVLGGGGATRRTAQTLPPQTYASEAFFELEMERIFRSDWVCVGHVSQIPEVGDYFSVDLAGEPLVVVRARDRIRVLSRVCLHRWVPIVSGSGNTKVFTCPFHLWAYRLDGTLMATPFMEGSEGHDIDTCRLPEIRMEVIEDLGLIFVTLAEEALPPISERLADFRAHYANWKMGDLVTIQNRESEAKFNWKIQIETFMECYHHIGAHPKTFEIDQPARLSSCSDGKAGWTVCHSPYRPELGVDAYSSGLVTCPDLTEDERATCDYVLVYPNLLLAIRPDSVSVLPVMPVRPDACAFRSLQLARPEAAAQPDLVAAARESKKDFFATTTQEDNDINELQQTMVRSRFARAGRLSQLETTVWDLANYVRGRVAAGHNQP